VKLQDPHPVYQKLLPRGVCRVNLKIPSGSHRACRHADSPNSQDILLN